MGTNSGRSIQRQTPEFGSQGSFTFISAAGRWKARSLEPVWSGNFVSEWKMLEAQTLDEEARQVKFYLLKINFPSYHAKKLKLSFYFFFSDGNSQCYWTTDWSNRERKRSNHRWWKAGVKVWVCSLLSMSGYKFKPYVIIVLFYPVPWCDIQKLSMSKDHYKKNKYWTGL